MAGGAILAARRSRIARRLNLSISAPCWLPDAPVNRFCPACQMIIIIIRFARPSSRARGARAQPVDNSGAQQMVW